MTATEIQNIARVLSNQTWCRYWLNLMDNHKPVFVAIQCRDANGKPERIPDIEKLGMAIKPDSDFLYVAVRTNDDGSEFVSKLF